MSLVRSVEEILITIGINDTVNTGTLTKGQIDNKCVPFTTCAAIAENTATLSNRFVRVTISGSTVTATRTVASSIISVDVIIFVVEFTDECTVQTGEVTITDTNTSITDSPPIDFVDLTKTFVYMTYTPNSTGTNLDDNYTTVEIINETTLDFSRVGIVDEIICRWYTVECDATQFDVQRGTFSFTGTANTATSAAFTAVTENRTMVIANFKTDEDITASEEGNCTVDLLTTTTVRARRALGTTPNDGKLLEINFQVIQFAAAENISVQRGEFLISATEDTDTITTVDLNRSMPHAPAGENGGEADSSGVTGIAQCFVKLDFQDDSTVRGQVGSAETNTGFSWEVIEWELEVIIPVIESFTVQTGNGTSDDLTAPAGLVENDMIIVVVAIDGDAANPQITDFTQFGQTSEGTTELYYLIKRATAAEPATYNITWTGNQGTRITVLRISGVLQSGAAIDTIDIIGTGTTGDATTANVAAITSTEIDTLAICAVSVDSNVVDADDGFSDAQGFVEEGTSGSGGPGGAGQIIGSKGLQGIGSSLSPTFGTWAAQGFGTRMFNLKPEPAVVEERVFSTAITNISAII